MDFENIAYLISGNIRQQRAYKVLKENLVFEKLKPFDPILTSTLPINIDIENSDLDIICSWTDKVQFRKIIEENFSKSSPEFVLTENKNHGRDTVLAKFKLDGFQIEIFGQNRPSTEQESYRHMLIEYELLKKRGETFRREIIRLKNEGLKTEPAFAKLLGLKEDPYTELLNYRENIKIQMSKFCLLRKKLKHHPKGLKSDGPT